MIIKRRKNEEEFLLEEKLFAEINCKEDLVEQDYFISVPLEIMKCIEMYDLDNGKYLKHWIRTKISDLMVNAVRVGISPQTLLIGVTGETTRVVYQVLNNKVFDLFSKRYKSLNLVSNVKYKLLTDTKTSFSEKAKYDRWFRSHPIELNDDIYTLIYRYFALCLSGQVDPRNITSFWEDVFQITKEKINYNVNKFRAEDELDKLFYNILYSIKCYYSGIIQPENL